MGKATGESTSKAWVQTARGRWLYWDRGRWKPAPRGVSPDAIAASRHDEPPPKPGKRKPPAAAPVGRPSKSKGGRKFRAVLNVLPKLYPPDGKVPDHVSTETVRQQAIVELGYDVSWNTANRALTRAE